MQRARWALNCSSDILLMCRLLEKQTGRKQDGNIMLVLFRTRDESIVVKELDGTFIVTVLQVRPCEVSVLVKCSSVEKWGELNSWTATLAPKAAIKVGRTAKVSLIDIRGQKAQVCVDAPKSTDVHRLDVREDIHK
jgi:hypothetical protein